MQKKDYEKIADIFKYGYDIGNLEQLRSEENNLLIAIYNNQYYLR